MLISLLILLNYPACNSSKDNFATPELLPIYTQTLSNTPAAQASQLLSLDQLRERWLGGIPCTPPCWEGIIPGQTPADEAIEILSLNPLFANVDYANISRYDQVSFQLQYQDEQGNVDSLSGHLHCDHLPGDQIIRVITVQIPPTPLSTIITSYGAPSYAATLEDLRAVPSEWSVYIIWEIAGLQLWKWNLDISQRVGENLLFEYADYFEPGLENYYTAFGQGWENTLFLWHGYADPPEYQYISPSIFPEEATPTP